ncbi:MAG TPA: transposase [Bacteroidia bacterium]|jgi:putative transposase|nr:transposase [Bacteroidia bacterium]
MSESYKTYADGLYFVSFSVVGWIDVFTRRNYQDILVDSISFCQANKNLKIYCYCIMPSHVHFITYSENGELSNILRDFKSFTSKKMIKTIEENIQESRREWMLNQFQWHGKISPHKQTMQFWQQSNHPFYLYSNKMIQQKVNYIHTNPVEAGFVNQPHEWRLSSANPESPVKLNEKI